MFGSNSIKIKSTKDWNEIIRKIHFSSELLFKRASFYSIALFWNHLSWKVGTLNKFDKFINCNTTTF